MKKTKVMSICFILMLVFCMSGLSLNVYAEEGRKQIDGSYLTDESESIGYDTKITRGEDLLAGYSKWSSLRWRNYHRMPDCGEDRTCCYYRESEGRGYFMGRI